MTHVLQGSCAEKVRTMGPGGEARRGAEEVGDSRRPTYASNKKPNNHINSQMCEASPNQVLMLDINSLVHIRGRVGAKPNNVF